MKALTLAAAAAVAAAFAIATPAQVRVQTAPVEGAPIWSDTVVASTEPELSHSTEFRALTLTGDPGRPFTVLVGLDRRNFEPIPGISLNIEVFAILHSGALDMFGHAYMPVDDQLQLPEGSALFFQAVLWPKGGSYPDQVTNFVKIRLRPFDTEPPIDEVIEDLWIVYEAADEVRREAEFLCICGMPPQVGVQLTMTVPTSGWDLRFDDVLHAGRFTRVLATLERPSDAELVEERLEDLEFIAPLGFWVGQVEILVRDLQRQPPIFDPYTPFPISKN